jgi:hypothetical protein
MRTTTRSPPPRSRRVVSHRGPQLRDCLLARLRAPWLDRQLAAGRAAPWSSPPHSPRRLRSPPIARAPRRAGRAARGTVQRLGRPALPRTGQRSVAADAHDRRSTALGRAGGRAGDRQAVRAAVRRGGSLLLTQRPRRVGDDLSVARRAGLTGSPQPPAWTRSASNSCPIRSTMRSPKTAAQTQELRRSQDPDALRDRLRQRRPGAR